MAKDDKAKVKMTVIHFETESDNATLQENIRAIAQTLTRALAPQPKVYGPSPQQLTGGNAPNGEPPNDDYVDVEESEEFQSPLSNNSSKKKKSSWQPRVPQPIEIELQLGPVSLKEFLEDKKPEGDVKRYLAITYWLRKYREIVEVNADYAYTCYRHMGWQVPADASQPFRNMKTKRYGWVKSGATKGTFVINHLGENEVEKMGA